MTKWDKKILQIVRKVNPDNPLQYVYNIVKEDARKKLDKQILSCQHCSIHTDAKTITYGSTFAKVLVVSGYMLPEQKRNNQTTFPLIGTEYWNILEQTFNFYEIDQKDLFYINTVNCCPFLTIEDDIMFRIPTINEQKSCHQFLMRAIQIIQPRFMIILGNVALNSLIKVSLEKVRGRVLDIMGIPSIATFDPDYLLRCKQQDQDKYECEKNIFFADCEKIKEEIQKTKEQL